jgi:nicotinamide-nucleotide amidase
MFPPDLETLAEEVLAACRTAGVRLALAESCTGGLIAGCLTAIAGSSDVFERGFVTYSNEAKMELLGVPEALLVAHGAVSEEVARAMAEGALSRSNAGISASVTGIAGPGGGTAEKPVGLVHMAVAAVNRQTLHQRHVFPGDRKTVRLRAMMAVLVLVEGMGSSFEI